MNHFPGTTSLTEQLDQRMLIVLRDGRHLVGILRSFDQYSNLVLEDTVERHVVGNMYSDISLGLYIIRGENIVLMGELDEEKEKEQAHLKEVSAADILEAEAALKLSGRDDEFQLCGERGPPAWLYRELPLLAQVSCFRVHDIVLEIIQLIRKEKWDLELIREKLSPTFSATEDMRACVMIIHYILTQSVRFNLDEKVLKTELEQLGVPKETTDAIAEPLYKHVHTIRDCLEESTLRISQLENMDWRIDMVIGTNLGQEIYEPTVQLKLQVNETPGTKCHDKRLATHKMNLTKEKFQVLYYELRQAQKLMETSI